MRKSSFLLLSLKVLIIAPLFFAGPRDLWGTSLCLLEEIRTEGQGTTFKIILATSCPVNYRYGFLPDCNVYGCKRGKLYIDLTPCCLGKALEKNLVNHPNFRFMRVAQFNDVTVRVVFRVENYVDPMREVEGNIIKMIFSLVNFSPYEALKKIKEGKKEYIGFPITLNCHKVPLTDIFKMFAELLQVNIVVSEKMNKKVTMVLRELPWDQVFDIVLKSNGLDMELRDNYIYVFPYEGQKVNQPLKVVNKVLPSLINVEIKILGFKNECMQRQGILINKTKSGYVESLGEVVSTYKVETVEEKEVSFEKRITDYKDGDTLIVLRLTPYIEGNGSLRISVRCEKIPLRSKDRDPKDKSSMELIETEVLMAQEDVLLIEGMGCQDQLSLYFLLRFYAVKAEGDRGFDTFQAQREG